MTTTFHYAPLSDEIVETKFEGRCCLEKILVDKSLQSCIRACKEQLTSHSIYSQALNNLFCGKLVIESIWYCEIIFVVTFNNHVVRKVIAKF